MLKGVFWNNCNSFLLTIGSEKSQRGWVTHSRSYNSHYKDQDQKLVLFQPYYALSVMKKIINIR